MTKEMKIQLGHPVLIFIHSVSLLMIGCAIGMHWHQSRSAAFWIAISGAVLTVIYESISGFIWCCFTASLIYKNRRSGGANGNV